MLIECLADRLQDQRPVAGGGTGTRTEAHSSREAGSSILVRVVDFCGFVSVFYRKIIINIYIVLVTVLSTLHT